MVFGHEPANSGKTDCNRQALAEGNTAKLGELMSRNFALRRSMFGDAALGEDNLHMVDLASQHGGAFPLGLSCTAEVPLWPRMSMQHHQS